MVLGHVLANLRDDVRANYDLPAILHRLLAPSAAQAVSNTLLQDDADPVKLVFEGIGTGFLLHAA